MRTDFPVLTQLMGAPMQVGGQISSICVGLYIWSTLAMNNTSTNKNALPFSELFPTKEVMVMSLFLLTDVFTYINEDNNSK